MAAWLTLGTEPIFDPASQQTRSPGERVYLIEDTPALRAGAEGTYAGHLRERNAVVDFDTPSGEPYRLTVPLASIRSLYR